MNLPKAIEIGTDYLRGDEPDKASDLPDSIRLGIEAMKRIEATRLVRKEGVIVLLPGETKD